MVAQTNDGPLFLLKKLGGLALVIVGCLLTALGMTFEYTNTTAVGLLFLVLGAVLLTLKIVTRNQGNRVG